MWSLEKVWRATQDPSTSPTSRSMSTNMSTRPEMFRDSAEGIWTISYLATPSCFLYEQTQASSTAQPPIHAQSLYYLPAQQRWGFWHSTDKPNQMWVDGVFMGEMFLARYGHATGDSTAFDEVVTQMTDIVNHCMKTDGLLLHAYDESKKASWANPTTGLSPEVWSEGLGWYAVLIADVFDYLPADHPGRPGLVTILGQLTAGLKANQDAKSGRWCQVVDECTLSDNWDESSGTGMFLYLTKKSIDKDTSTAPNTTRWSAAPTRVWCRRRPVNSDGTIRHQRLQQHRSARELQCLWSARPTGQSTLVCEFVHRRHVDGKRDRVHHQ